jgi:hypothetical protein
MEPIYVAALLSFIAGLLGYIIIRFWILPIGRYLNDLPYWYRLNLESKKEQPLEAAKFSMRLANTLKPEHALQQVNEIKRLLRIKR